MQKAFVTLLATTFLTGAAIAQTPAPTTAPTAAPAATTMTSGWRASKLIGVTIYNMQNETVGDINEVILDSTGKVAGYVLGVGGFLGMGEHDVLVKAEDLKFVNEARTTTTTTTPPATTPAARPARAANEKWYPDHAIINATKDQLKAVPQFRYTASN